MTAVHPMMVYDGGFSYSKTLAFSSHFFFKPWEFEALLEDGPKLFFDCCFVGRSGASEHTPEPFGLFA